MKRSVKEQVGTLLNPRSIAVIGASDNPKRIGGRPISLLRKFGFPGTVYGVNPKYTTVQSLPCFPTPADLPEPVDLAIFAVPAEVAVDQFEEMCRLGMKSAIIFAGGFAEIGGEGQALQERLSSLVREYGVALNGPNCLGVMSTASRNYSSFSSAAESLPQLEPGNIALVSQSGGFAINMFIEAILAGARFSHMISSGNEVGLDFCDYLEYLVDDPVTSTVLGYLEGVRDGQRFCRVLARYQAAGKPLLLIKVGKSPGGAVTVRSHTGLMSGSDAAFDAAFARYGVIRLQTMEDLLDHIRVFALPPISGGLGVATVSGGAAAYVADACFDLGVPLTELQPESLARLREVVPKFGIVRNPVDFTAQFQTDRSVLHGSVDTLMNDPGTGAVMVFIGGSNDAAGIIIQSLQEIQDRSSKPLVFAWSGVPEQARLQATAGGIRVFSDPIRFLRPLATRLAMEKSRESRSRAGAPEAESQGEGRRAGDKPQPAGCGDVGQGLVPCHWLQWAVGDKPLPHANELEVSPQVRREQLREVAPGRWVLDEWSAMALVESAGVSTPRRWRVSNVEEMRRTAAEVRYPCVVKLLEPVVAHRAQVGAVQTGVGDAKQLVDCWNRLAQQHAARVVVVAEQVGPGLELLVGAVRDEIFGQRVVVGAGGVWTNELNDSVTLVPPLDGGYIEERLRALRLWPLLKGGVRQSGYSVDSVVRAVQRIAALAWRERDLLEEFECNPVIVTEEDVIAVDALGMAHQVGSWW